MAEESFTVKVKFPDNSETTFEAGAEEYVLGAARRAGLDLPSLCEQGWDLACAVKVLEGEVDQSDSLRYFEEDKECGFALICTGKARSDLRIVPHQTGEMRECRDEHGLPAPRGT
ncbi:MAG: 2Fe-2S iron-sulfur cluster binding domain-containing protein [Rubrobacter sp.]|nr:2Fe-2S iron-sulfur cluster binding domain-containing protein [Rubrobacter sp.]